MAAIAIMALATAGGVLATLPPAPVPAVAPIDEFSALRAMQHVERIAATPHPVGSAAHDTVRDYLVAQLRTLGMVVEVQSGVTPGRAAGTVLPLENIIARREGTTAGRALLLMAHYDAVPAAPGAADDASGVAAILEALRALGPVPMRNELIVLFSDGEELGLRGAELFVREHPLAGRVGMVLNFEARGSSGPSYLFQTTPGNGPLIREVARVAPYPRANSLTGEVYRRLPNDTDLSVFLRDLPGVHGLNFAFIDGFADYHTPGDAPDALDQRSLQHQGSWALALTERFGHIDLDRLQGADAVYFDAPLVGLIHYPASWAMPLALAAFASLLAVVVVGIARARISARHLGWGALLVVGAVGAPAMLASAGWQAVVAAAGGSVELQSPLAVSIPLLLAEIALGAGIATWCMRVIGRKASPLELAVAPLVVWSVLAVAAAYWLPGASWILTWPVLSAIIALACAVRVTASADARLMAAAIATMPLLVLVPPVLWQTQVALTNHLAAFLAGVAGLVAIGATLPIATLVSRGSRS